MSARKKPFFHAFSRCSVFPLSGKLPLSEFFPPSGQHGANAPHLPHASEKGQKSDVAFPAHAEYHSPNALSASSRCNHTVIETPSP